jgi:hypothetical protein
MLLALHGSRILPLGVLILEGIDQWNLFQSSLGGYHETSSKKLAASLRCLTHGVGPSPDISPTMLTSLKGDSPMWTISSMR